MVFFFEVYLSKIQGKGIYDPKGEFVGRVKDVLVEIEVETPASFPKVSGLLLQQGKDKRCLSLDMVDVFNETLLYTKLPREQLVLNPAPTNAIYLVRDLLDKQVVDTDGFKVVRVNDLKLAKLNQEVRLIAASVGMRGLLRRIGLEGLALLVSKLFRKDLTDTLISWNLIEPLHTSFEAVKLTIPHDKLSGLHPADIAEIISQVHPEEQSAIISALAEEQAADALSELEPVVQVNILENLKAVKAKKILEKMPPDEAADLLGDLTKEQAQAYLAQMDVKEAADVRPLLKHSDRTAGGLMTPEFIAFPKTLRVDETIEQLRKLAPEAETIYYLYVVEAENHLVGVLGLRDLIIAHPNQTLKEIMIQKVISVSPETNELKVATLFSKYNLLAIPVVEPKDKLIGIVTVDDILEVLLPPWARRKRTLI